MSTCVFLFHMFIKLRYHIMAILLQNINRKITAGKVISLDSGGSSKHLNH